MNPRRGRAQILLPISLLVALFAATWGAYFAWLAVGPAWSRGRTPEARADASDPLVVLIETRLQEAADGPARERAENHETASAPPVDPEEAPAGSSPPDPGPPEDDEKANLILAAGEARARGDLDLAHRLLSEALALGPDAGIESELRELRLEIEARDMEAANRAEYAKRLAAGAEHESMGRLAEARTAYQSAGECLSSLATREREELESRLARVEKALLAELDTGDLERWRRTANQAFEAGNWEEADEAFRMARTFGALSSTDEERAGSARLARLRQGMVLIPAGVFVTGSEDLSTGDAPLARVKIEAFYIDRLEVTNGQYRRFVDESGHPAPPTWAGTAPQAGREDDPTTGVNWYDASAYARWAGKRLPTELEWERAARGTDGRLYPWGNEFEPGRANTYEEGLKGPIASGRFERGGSPEGCLEMAGNVLEWTASEVADHEGETVVIMKGGCWWFDGRSARASKRFLAKPSSRLRSNGFRCAADVDR